MIIIQTVVITLVTYWVIGFIIGALDKDDWLPYWATGLVYPLIYILIYPARAWLQYEKNRIYYQNHNIARWEYILLHRRTTRWWKKERKS